MGEPNGTSEETATYIGELMRKQLVAAKIDNPLVIAEWQEKAKHLSLDNFLQEAQDFAASPAVGVFRIDTAPLHEFIKATKMEVWNAHETNPYSVTEDMKNAIRPTLRATKRGVVLFTTKLELSYEQSKTLVKELLDEEYNTNPNVTPDLILMPFLISHQQKLKGQVLSNLDSAKKSVNLITVYRVGGRFLYQFFGMPKPHEAKTAPTFARFNDLFYIYRFIDDETSEEIILLAQKELQLEACQIIGMEATCYDFIKIGAMAKISTTTKVFFVAEQHPEIDRIDEKTFWEYADGATTDTLTQTAFGKYPHPPWFSTFMLSWMFSGKISGMPTHLSFLSPPSSGKTALLGCLSATFKQDVNGGGTVKGLVPSFANGVPREGYMIKAKRFAFIDEFIHILRESNRIGGDFEDSSNKLLKVLEHSEDDFSSGFGKIRAKPKSWCLFVANIKPHEHVQNLVDLHTKLNAAFMSRLLWYVYDQDHIDFINKAKPTVMTLNPKAAQPEYNPKFVSMVDYLHSFTLDIPSQDAQDIHAKWLPFVPSSLVGDIYDSRMVLHIYRMLDGYAKYKSIIEKRGCFELTLKDKEEVDALIGRIVRSWSYGLKPQELPAKMKVAYLNSAQRSVYEFVQLNQGCDMFTLEKGAGAPSAVVLANDLAEKGMLKRVMGFAGIDQYYTFDAV